MEIIELTRQPGEEYPAKLNKRLKKLDDFLTALRKKDLSEKSVDIINTAVHSLNHFHGDERDLMKQVKTAYSRLYQYSVKELGLVPKNYYQAMWIGLGMAIFGVPLGIAMGTALGNFAFAGIGPAMGLPIGIAIGAAKDKQAAETGRQLDFTG